MFVIYTSSLTWYTGELFHKEIVNAKFTTLKNNNKQQQFVCGCNL